MRGLIEPSKQEQAEYRHKHRFSATLKGALLGGAIVWLFPAGNPWTSFFSPSGALVMGRPVSADPSITVLSLGALPAHLAHFAVSILFGFILLAVVYRLRSWKAIAAGAVVGAVLYGINYAVFRMFAPQFTGVYEFNVALAHILFGGIAAGAIRGFLGAPQKVDPNEPNSGPVYP